MKSLTKFKNPRNILSGRSRVPVVVGVCKVIIISNPNAHWAKNRGQKDINSKIGGKIKIMNLLDGFQSPVMNRNHFKDFLMKF